MSFTRAAPHLLGSRAVTLHLVIACALAAGCSGVGNDDLNHPLATASDDGGAKVVEGRCSDDDGDGFGAGCSVGRDCDDQDAARALGMDAFRDGDRDTYGSEPVYVCVDAEGELPPGYALEGGDCDDDDKLINPGVEIDGCDDIDIDCDDKIDEDRVPLPTTCGAGACKGTGESTCTDHGAVDSCATGQVTGNDEDCNGKDDDCDGVVDDGFKPTRSSCMRDGCSATGMVQCIDGVVVDDCQAPSKAMSDSTCDGLDDDCDGQVDEDFAPQSTACGAGACVAGGQTSCRDGKVIDSCMAGSGQGADDDCDGVDDDCDGLPDDGFVVIDSTCGAGACRATGRISCLGGHRVDSCMGSLPGGSDTTCDGLDDDCDGQVDEDYRGPSRTCGRGACQRSAPDVCVKGQVQSACSAGIGAASDANCDGVDDDCSGEADEDFAARASTCGVGACQRTGNVSCGGGQESNSCTPGDATGTDNDCDGVDDDCDGSVDEAYVATRTNCGAGACAANGFLRCVAGRTVDTCSESAPGGSDATCDGVDSDCDGRPDDDYVSRSVTCGVGACRRTVQTSCVNGVEQGCTPGTSTGNDDDCDGIDDDCDGSTDEGYPGAVTSCGVGACARTGRRGCVSGAVVDSCRAGTPAASDANCDNVDDDCSGTADEDYSVPTQCGLGVCRRNGTQTCRNGQTVDSCSPGTATAASDMTCNNVDEDCSGTADEDFVTRTTSCGVGACARMGQTMCIGGQPVDSCLAGTSTVPDTNCDGVDDDCDGAADDNYPQTATTCGVGACAARGTSSCVRGRVVDSCKATEPTSTTDATCDGRDDDCSGTADEDFGTQSITCGEGKCQTKGLRACKGGKFSDDCRAEANVCKAAGAPFCSNKSQECTGSMTCTGEACGCDVPKTCSPVAGAIVCNAAGQVCKGRDVCGVGCNCDTSSTPKCDMSKAVCSADGGSLCGVLGCTTCCTRCLNGCNPKLNACAPLTRLPTQVEGPLTRQAESLFE